MEQDLSSRAAGTEQWAIRALDNIPKMRSMDFCFAKCSFTGNNYSPPTSSQPPVSSTGLDHLKARVEALELWRAQSGQHNFTPGSHVPCECATRHQCSPAPGIEAVGINASPASTEGYRPAPPTFSQSNLQDISPVNNEYEFILPVQSNTISWPHIPPIAADHSGYLLTDGWLLTGENKISAANVSTYPSMGGEQLPGYSNFSTANANAAQPLGETQTIYMASQGGDGMQLTRSSVANEFDGGDYMDSMFDFSAASMPFDTNANVEFNMPDVNQEDHDHETMAAAATYTISTSPRSGATRALIDCSRPHRCVVSMNCHKTFARKADRDRHSRTHDRHSIRPFSCLFQGCDRVGPNGFWRLDKLNEHKDKRGHWIRRA
ncbi:hypothetical protein BKA65DRAFT_548774 [Rhexocercosporidium sp. MPI-PUGE-AT-0058]|nr:hypothetical protein BKA65DRAFT_548774 [Rhexocercosporidium sp. MPI-PUGE-AT-0058]